ncbi:MAG: metal-dependent hydrolase [Lachnospiraceae bacterium]|nr:metal-dependent hydrolase [Lachnospiraceae bacterium]
MTGRTHVAIGITVSASISLSALCLHEFYNPSPLQLAGMAIFIPTTVIGSLLPDIDHPDATLSKNSPRIFRFLFRYIMSAGDYFGHQSQKYTRDLSGHRGICHSFSACISVLTLLMPFFLFNPILFFESGIHGLIFGMLLHILCDATTPAGVMLFAPFSTKHYHIKMPKLTIKHIEKENKFKRKIKYTESDRNFKNSFLTGCLYICNLIFTWFKLLLSYFLIIILLLLFSVILDFFMGWHSFTSFTILSTFEKKITIISGILLFIIIPVSTLIITNKIRKKISTYLYQQYLIAKAEYYL